MDRLLSRGLVLSHYDAKAHLVVARRVIDNLTPGWQQIGAVWLPLPHLIELLPTQVDLLYRTGRVRITRLDRLSRRHDVRGGAADSSRDGLDVSARASAPALLVLNPNLLYLHATPMTEPLLLATTVLAVLWLLEWVEMDDATSCRRSLRAVLFAATWTRYEAWAVIGAAMLAAGYATWRRGAAIDTLVATRVATGGLADPCRRCLSDQQPDHSRRLVCQRRVLRS